MSVLTSTTLITALNSGWNNSIIALPKMIDGQVVPDEDKLPPNLGYPSLYVRIGNIGQEPVGHTYAAQVTTIPFRIRVMSKSLADMEDLANEVTRIIMGLSLTGGWYAPTNTSRNERELVKKWDLFFTQTKWITNGAL